MSRRASAIPSAQRYEDSPLARHRYDAGLTQEQLASEFGIALRTLQRIESGQSLPRPDLASRIARRFGVTPADLFLAGAARPGSTS